MDKINATKNNADGGAIGNSKQPLIRTMTEDIETLKHDLSQAKPAPKKSPPNDLPIASSAAPAPAKKPQAFGEPPFVPFANKQKPETGPQKPERIVRSEENLPPIARLARQKAPANVNLMPKEEKTSRDMRKEQAGLSGIRPQANSQTYAPSVFKKVLIVVLAAVFVFSAYYFIKTVFNKPAVVLPAAEIPPSLIFDSKDVNISADFNSGLTLGVRKYLEDNKNRTDVYGVSRLIIKSIAGTEILKIENLKDFLGINLPAGFLEAVDKNYSLLSFDYPEKNYLRLGLVFKIAKPEIIGYEASNWEPKMFGDLSALFLGSPAFYNPVQNFASNAYLGASVRYLPLGESITALNYAIDKNKTFFMLATSKDDIYYLIEKIAKNQ